jgi:hypothetical protein
MHSWNPHQRPILANLEPPESTADAGVKIVEEIAI